LTDDLTIGHVDFDNDVALLVSPELLTKYPEALAVANEAPMAGQRLTVYGYPERLRKAIPTTDLTVRASIVSVSDLLPLKEADEIEQRTSPSLQASVISIQGHILPGHSGAPVVDGAGFVVGLGQGGLKAGTVEISWAVIPPAFDSGHTRTAVPVSSLS
jgi:hypothetical protein